MHFNLHSLALVALATTAAASPLNAMEMEASANVTSVDPYIGTTMLGPQRHEMPWYVTCGRFNKFLFKQWIVQAPPTWWKKMHNNDTRKACKHWKKKIEGSNTGGGTVWQECWDMGNKKHASGKPHYLHMRFTTAVWAKDRKIEGGMWAALDKDHWKDDPEFNNLQVACGGYNRRCESHWKKNNRCYKRNGALHD